MLIPDEDRDRFVHQARREEMTLSAWMRTAARQRLEEQQRSKPFQSPAEVEAFFQRCDALEGTETETEWKQHLGVMDDSRKRGAANT